MVRYRLGDRLSRRYAVKFLASSIQMEYDGTLADPQDDTGFQCGLARGSPFQTIKLLGGYQKLLLSIVPVHPQYVAVKIVCKNTALTQHDAGSIERRRRGHGKERVFLPAAYSATAWQSGPSLCGTLQGGGEAAAILLETDRLAAAKLLHTNIGVNAMSEISRPTTGTQIDTNVLQTDQVIQIFGCA